MHDSGISGLISPKAIAVVGVSGQIMPGGFKPGGRAVIDHLQKHGYSGSIFPVNPKHDEIDGLRCYSSIQALPPETDCLVIAVRADAVVDAVRDAGARGIPFAIVLSAGFAEAGSDGVDAQEKLVHEAKKSGIRLLGPNTTGVINVNERIAASMTSVLQGPSLSPGRLGLITQSGALGGSLLDRARDRGLGVSCAVNVGNEADIDIADVIDHFAQDAQTEVIALHLESLKDARRFRAAVERAVAGGTRVLVFKVGRTDAGAKAARSHTGGLTGSDRVYDAVFRQLRVTRISRLDDLIDIPLALESGKFLRGRRLGLISASGGLASALTDLLAGPPFDFDFPDPALETVESLRPILPEYAAAANPTDTGPGSLPHGYIHALRAFASDPGFDGIVVALPLLSPAWSSAIAADTVTVAKEIDKPVVVCWFAGAMVSTAMEMLRSSGIPAFDSPEACAAAVSGICEVQRPARIDAAAPAANRSHLHWLESLSGPPDEHEVRNLLREAGVNCIAELVVSDEHEAIAAASQLGYPVAVKVLSTSITHKAQAGGVALNLQTADAVAAAVRGIAATIAVPEGNRYLVQAMAPSGGIELIVGVRRDSQFGHLAVVGVGGVMADLLDDVSLRLTPIAPPDVVEMLAELRSSSLLSQLSHGQLQYDNVAQQVSKAISAITGLGDRVSEFEINPLICYPGDIAPVVVDSLMVLDSP